MWRPRSQRPTLCNIIGTACCWSSTMVNARRREVETQGTINRLGKIKQPYTLEYSCKRLASWKPFLLLKTRQSWDKLLICHSKTLLWNSTSFIKAFQIKLIPIWLPLTSNNTKQNLNAKAPLGNAKLISCCVDTGSIKQKQDLSTNTKSIWSDNSPTQDRRCCVARRETCLRESKFRHQPANIAQPMSGMSDHQNHPHNKGHLQKTAC